MRFSRKSTGHSLSPRRPACSGCQSPCPRRRFPGTPGAAAVPSHSGHRVHFENDIQSREPVITALNHPHVHTGQLGLPGSACSGQDRDRTVLARREDKLKRRLAPSQGATLPGRLEVTVRSTHVTAKCGGDGGGVGRRDGGQEMWSSSWRRPVVPCA